MSLNLFRRLDRYDRRIRQLERTEPPEGGGGGGDHVDSDHADAFSALGHAHAGTYAPVEHDTTHDDRFSQLAHVHAVHADSDHDDRFSLLAHTHGAPGAHTHDWGDVTGEPATFPPTPQLLDWLTDVATAGQTTTNVLTYNGSAWVPAAIPAQTWTSITGKPSLFPPVEQELGWLTDVNTIGVDSGDVLVWDGFIWKPVAPPSPGGVHPDTDHISFHPLHGDPVISLDANTVTISDKAVFKAGTAGALRANIGWNGVSDRLGFATSPDGSAFTERGYLQNDGLFYMTDIRTKTVTLTSGGPVETTDTRYAHNSHTHAVHADSDHDDRFSLLAHTHTGTYAPAAGTWQSVAGTYFTGWGAVAGDQAPRYRLEGDTVRLDGAAGRTSGSLATMFTLPAGYRPTQVKRFWPAGGASAAVRIAVGTDGIVSQTAGTDFTRTSLEGCSFPIT